MYVKIPPSLGDQNINLTMEYLQEEENPTPEKGGEEKTTVHLLVSGLFSVTPNHKNIGSCNCMNWHKLDKVLSI